MRPMTWNSIVWVVAIYAWRCCVDDDHPCKINAWLQNVDRRMIHIPKQNDFRTSRISLVDLRSTIRGDDDRNTSQTPQVEVVPSKYISKKNVGRTDSRNVTIECTGNHDVEDSMDKIQDRKFMERNTHWIVLVDDELSIRQSVGDFLYDSGYQVTACADAYAFVELCRTLTTTTSLTSSGVPMDSQAITTTTTTGTQPVNNVIPSCVVSDVRMPGGPDGLELLQWIRTSDRFNRIPVILLTAKGMTQDRISGYQAGADAYLPKPFDPDELLSIIDTVIVRRQQMTGKAGALVDLQQDLVNVKLLLQQNVPTPSTLQPTKVYLTPAVREVLNLLCLGYTNAEIAHTRNTTKAYVTKVLKRVYDETGTSTRTELLRWAIQTGYVNPKL
jgi:DNA-binding NarL/FixJ family response regulator